MEFLPLFLFFALLVSILIGFPVAFTLGGISIIFGLIFTDMTVFDFLPFRLFGTMTNFLLLAIPLFIFMGQTLEKTGIAEEMLTTMNKLLSGIRGGLTLSIVVVGAVLGASTGIVGASVTTMGLLSLPVMLKEGYRHPIATGVIAASGTLGQIIPPSIVLVLLGSVLNISVGDMFKSALIPSAILVSSYSIYVLVYSFFYPPEKKNTSANERIPLSKIASSFVIPILLIVSVLGSIYSGIASPTEAAGIGAFMAAVLGFVKKQLNFAKIKEIAKNTTQTSGMIFTILFGASCFSLVFRELGGDTFFVDLINRWSLSPYQFLMITMVVIFFVGFFIDFIEIIFIFIPILLPILNLYNFDLLWVGILVALNLQTSFLTPPFGFSLFYLKGVAPKEVRTQSIYRGIIPFIIIQIATFIIIFAYPELIIL